MSGAPLTRRGFLAGACALAAGCAAAGPRTTARPETSAMPVVDTHVHCFAGPDDARFPYHADAPYRPKDIATPEHLLRCMDGAGVGFAIVVHPEPYQDDHRYLEHCLAVGKGRLKGTCLFFSGKPDAPAQLAALARRTPLVAARVHAYAPGRMPPFGKPELRALWQAAADAGLMMQLHFEPRWAPGFAPLIDEFRSTTVIIDHLGRPLQGTPEEHEMVVRWADKPNTVIKLASYTEATKYPHRDIAPAVRRLADAYGAGRMIWGGGSGAEATADSYRAEREAGRRLIAHLSADDQALVLGGTAARLFRFG
jgi:predicted TIM-barrel fold metal-dependent hydrolase